MITRLRMIARVGLFAALIYVLSWATAYLPNVNFIFFIVFVSGYLWGAKPGFLVGFIGMGLWTGLNPFGPAVLPIMAVQTIGAGLSGLAGRSFQIIARDSWGTKQRLAALVLAAIICTLLYYLPVIIVDAWLFQPFWPRFISGLPWVAISIISNVLIFSLLFGRVVDLYSHRIKINRV
jgi:hypothetical protein